MPRQARLDAPDVLQHVMVRGIERTLIFRNTTDRADFVARVAALAERGAWSVLAWAVLPNHARLLVRTGNWPLARELRIGPESVLYFLAKLVREGQVTIAEIRVTPAPA